MPPPDLIPLLPRGTTVFDTLPARALVLEPLAPAIGDGVVVIRRTDAVGVVLIRSGAIAETYCVEGTERSTGTPALAHIRSWTDATMSAWRLSNAVVDVIPPLLRSEPHYADLRLEWVNWERLLSDLRGRPGAFIVELITPVGRGVISLRDGNFVASFTDTHPELCEPSLLDEIASANSGSLRVLREQTGTVLFDDVANAGAPDDTDYQMVGSAPVEYGSTTEPSKSSGRETAGGSAAAGDDGETAAPPEEPSPAPQPESRSMLRQLLGLGQQQSSAAAAAETATAADGPGASVASLLPTLKLIAFNHTHRSEPALENLFTEAAAQSRSVEWLALAVRNTPVPFVTQATLDDIADAILGLASQPAH
jgi:hypothetical protein